jgi:hypothetical protein
VYIEKQGCLWLHELVYINWRKELRIIAEQVLAPDGEGETHEGGGAQEEAVRADLFLRAGELELQVLWPCIITECKHNIEWLIYNVLQIKYEDVELWAIEAIASGIIDGKID